MLFHLLVPICTVGIISSLLTHLSGFLGGPKETEGGSVSSLGLWCSPVQALAVADGGVLPGEGQQHSAELVGEAGGRTGEVLVVGEGTVQVQLDLAGSRVLTGLAPAQQLLVAARGLQVLNAEVDQPPPDTWPVLAGHTCPQQLLELNRGCKLTQGSPALSQWPLHSLVGQQVVGAHLQCLDLGQQLQVLHLVVGHRQEAILIILAASKKPILATPCRALPQMRGSMEGWTLGKVPALALPQVRHAALDRSLQFLELWFAHLSNE